MKNERSNMKEPKRYYCGYGEGMFEDDKNGHWVEYSEHKAIVEALTEQLHQHFVSGQLEAIRTDFCLWYYAQSQPLDAHKVVDWFASNLR